MIIENHNNFIIGIPDYEISYEQNVVHTTIFLKREGNKIIQWDIVFNGFHEMLAVGKPKIIVLKNEEEALKYIDKAMLLEGL